MTHDLAKEVILSLSENDSDFVITTHKNKCGRQILNNQSPRVSVLHTPSGAREESQIYKTYQKNRVEAFNRLLNSFKFKLWLGSELAQMDLYLDQRGANKSIRGNSSNTGISDISRNKVIKDLKEEDIRCKFISSFKD